MIAHFKMKRREWLKCHQEARKSVLLLYHTKRQNLDCCEKFHVQHPATFSSKRQHQPRISVMLWLAPPRKSFLMIITHNPNVVPCILARFAGGFFKKFTSPRAWQIAPYDWISLETLMFSSTSQIGAMYFFFDHIEHRFTNRHDLVYFLNRRIDRLSIFFSINSATFKYEAALSCSVTFRIYDSTSVHNLIFDRWNISRFLQKSWYSVE